MEDRKWYEQLVADARERNDKQYLASQLGALGNQCATERDFQAALEYLNESLDIYRSISSNQGVANKCYTIAGVYELGIRDYENAMCYLEMGIGFDDRKDSKDEHIDRLIELEIQTGRLERIPASFVPRQRQLGHSVWTR